MCYYEDPTDLTFLQMEAPDDITANEAALQRATESVAEVAMAMGAALIDSDDPERSPTRRQFDESVYRGWCCILYHVSQLENRPNDNFSAAWWDAYDIADNEGRLEPLRDMIVDFCAMFEEDAENLETSFEFMAEDAYVVLVREGDMDGTLAELIDGTDEDDSLRGFFVGR